MTAPHDDITTATAWTEAEMRPQRVPVNVYAAKEAMVLVAPLPAVRCEDVRIELRPGDPATLRFWAHLRSAGRREYLVHEWEYGGYERLLELPSGFGGGARGVAAQRPARGAGPPRRLHPAAHADPVVSIGGFHAGRPRTEHSDATKHSDGVSRGCCCGGRRRWGR